MGFPNREAFFMSAIDRISRQEKMPGDKKLFEYLLELPLEKHIPFNRTRQYHRAIFFHDRDRRQEC